MSKCSTCDNTGWYSITVAEFERKHNATTNLTPDLLMSFLCLEDHNDILDGIIIPLEENDASNSK